MLPSTAMLFRMCSRCRVSQGILRSAAAADSTALRHSSCPSVRGELGRHPTRTPARIHGYLPETGTSFAVARSLSKAVCVGSTTSTQKELRLQHILVPKSARELLESIDAELKGGADFEELARKHSKCPSASSGGELGWVSESMGLHPALQEAIFALDVGEHTTVETADELHIFKAVEERDAPGVHIMMVDELEALLKEGPEAAQFLDVREQQEHDIASLPYFQLRPLSRLQEWLPSMREELDPDKPTVCLCHAGVRSMQVANILLSQGFTSVHNVSGGIEAYSCFVDPSVPRY